MNGEERQELVRRLFAQMTAKLEDAVSQAVEGQRANSAASLQIARAENLETLARDVGLTAQAIAAILRSNGPQQ